MPAWAHGAPRSLLGADSTVDFVLQPVLRDRAGLDRYAARVSDPASPDYQHFLTADQYAATYAPAQQTVSTITSVLQAAGLSVDSTTEHGSYLAVHGPASAVGALFSTSFGSFRVHGDNLRSPLSAPQLPSALDGLVANVAGLAQSAPLQPTHLADVTPAAGAVFLNARPCSDSYGEKTATDAPSYLGSARPYAVCGYTGPTLREAYGLSATGLTGTGATIGIVDAYASPTILEDANTYATNHGEQPFTDGQFTEAVPFGVQQVPEDPTGVGLIDPDGWAGEETLDVEAAHAMAPDADIVYQTGVTPYGPMLYGAIAALVEQDDVQVISDSFGTASDDPLPTDKLLFDQITSQATAQGITIAFSSGDSGDETDPSANGERSADFPATSDGVVAVGGTTLEIGADGTRQRETYWGTSKYLENSDHTDWDLSTAIYGGAGGGGVSTSYAEPDWQQDVVPTSLATYGGVSAGRVVPDVSMLGDPTTGFLMGQTQAFPDGSSKYSEYRIGGTSLACPLFAGLLALAVEKHAGGLGLVTPALYAASTSADAIASVFNDPSDVEVANGTSTYANVRPDYTDPSDATSPVVDSLRTLGNLATLHALPGYDDSTGLGSPKAAAVIAVLNGEPVPGTGTGGGGDGGSGGGGGTTTQQYPDVTFATVRAVRHAGRVVAHVQVTNPGDVGSGRFRVEVRKAGQTLAHGVVDGLAGHAKTSLKLVWRRDVDARRVLIIIDPDHRLHQASRQGDRRPTRIGH